jgi:hypothetical protein
MLKTSVLIVSFFLILLSPINHLFAESMTVCLPMEKQRAFNCSVTILGDLKVEPRVNMTMPSMSMAHNVPAAVLNANTEKPGEYQFFVELPMLGEWRFSYDITAPKRDRISNRLMFKKGQVVSSAESQTENRSGNQKPVKVKHAEHSTTLKTN